MIETTLIRLLRRYEHILELLERCTTDDMRKTAMESYYSHKVNEMKFLLDMLQQPRPPVFPKEVLKKEYQAHYMKWRKDLRLVRVK